MKRREIMGSSDKFLTVAIVPIILLIVLSLILSPGCSAGRQGGEHRETIAETNMVRTDSLLFQNLFRASRNKTIDLEHVVFDTCRFSTLSSDSGRTTALLPIHSITHIAINEQGEQEAKASIKSGLVSSDRLVSSESLQKSYAANFSHNKLFFSLLLILLLIFLVRLWSRGA